ncbi:MAG: cobalt ECF transporter T component CbiQ [Methanomicrobiaceae archaeon]|nr:cobalt ECF transporter T component CbiQ [Methanomicrobiaceae archaeon]
MIELLASIERDAGGSSIIHGIDARIKLLVSIAVIVAAVAYPYAVSVYWFGLLFGGVLVILWAASRLSPRTYLQRFLMVLPFGFFLIVFQIFFKNPHYESFSPLFVLPAGMTIWTESVEFASILMVKFVICISCVILLSSTTPIHDLLRGARRLGLPSVVVLSLGMMVRYLFVFAGMYDRVGAALAAKNFHPLDASLPYRYRIRTLGYTIGMFFIRSYEQGERTYACMLSRGYGADCLDALPPKPFTAPERAALLFSFLFVVAGAVGCWVMTA